MEKSRTLIIKLYPEVSNLTRENPPIASFIVKVVCPTGDRKCFVHPGKLSQSPSGLFPDENSLSQVQHEKISHSVLVYSHFETYNLFYMQKLLISCSGGVRILSGQLRFH